MTKINATNVDFKELNQQVKNAKSDVCIDECYGQRFIGSALCGKNVTINGTPGNALGAYLDGAKIVVNGNAQDAVGDTMNDGEIVIHGNAGDALGYAMRGGAIYVRGNAGYRTGIHMKEYKEKKPVIVIGESAGSFLGEYMAGGVIIVLGINAENAMPVGNFTGTGMHGGKIFIRANKKPVDLPKQVIAEVATEDDVSEIKKFIEKYAKLFSVDAKSLLQDKFYMLAPNAKNPYKQLYTMN